MPQDPEGPVAPPLDCALCPRLAGFRAENSAAFPDWHNAPVPSFGELSAALLIVGLAPGLRGANRTGRPFTGDHAGDLLFPTLAKFGFLDGLYDRRPDDGVAAVNCRIANAVRCVPPKNRPTGAEARACRPFLVGEIEAMTRLSVILALGRTAHDATLSALGERRADHRFVHGAMHGLGGGLVLADSYHCSRYNTNTGVLTVEMFESVFRAIVRHLGGAEG